MAPARRRADRRSKVDLPDLLLFWSEAAPKRRKCAQSDLFGYGRGRTKVGAFTERPAGHRRHRRRQKARAGGGVVRDGCDVARQRGVRRRGVPLRGVRQSSDHGRVAGAAQVRGQRRGQQMARVGGAAGGRRVWAGGGVPENRDVVARAGGRSRRVHRRGAAATGAEATMRPPSRRDGRRRRCSPEAHVGGKEQSRRRGGCRPGVPPAGRGPAACRSSREDAGSGIVEAGRGCAGAVRRPRLWRRQQARPRAD